MALKQERHEWELPHLRETHQLPSVSTDFWSVKFYPYTEPGVDPVFAVVGGKHVLICRPPPAGKDNKTIEVSQVIVDEDPSADHYTCIWTKNLQTGVPQLCVAGVNAKINIIDALTGNLERTLAGHGGEINDLAISPVNPQILASASEDCTVRIWSLDPAHVKQPCAAILAGDGHRETILTLSFHATGRYLLSGGVDHIINLWTLPEFPDANTGTNKPTRIHYPHFSSSEVHSDIVDCISFYGDLILSKANNENCIVLWSISGFSSAVPPPSPSSAPTTHDSQRDTRSAFSPTSSSTGPSNQYTRLLQFSIPDSEIMFMRFGLYPGSSSTNPVLAMCNGGSKVFFWDFARLEEYYDYITALPSAPSGGAKTSHSTTATGSNATTQEPKRPPFLAPFRHRNRGGAAQAPAPGPKGSLSRLRENSPSDSASSHQTGSDSVGPGKEDLVKSKEIWSRRYDIGNPLRDIQPHKEEVVKGVTFVGRQVAWSMGGEWCVIVGSSTVVAVFQRWGK